MGSETTLSLPVIDFSKEALKPGTPEWDQVKDQVRQSLEECGCFEAKCDGITIELRKAFFGALEELFDLPLETKMRNASKKPFHGYAGQYPTMPLYESMGIDAPNNTENVESVTNILWPNGNPSFSKPIQSFSSDVSELDQRIRRMILESFGLEKCIDEHINSTYYLLRVNKYAGPQTTENKVGMTAHKDKLMLTILYQDEVPGLEVQTKDGKWMKPSLNSFIVMVGDSLNAYSNGRLHAPYHRVMMTGTEARYSVGLFSIPKAGYLLKAPEELVDEEHPLLFKPFDHGEFLKFFYSEKGLRDENPLKTFCGV